MHRNPTRQLADAELLALFDRLFPAGLGGPDVIAAIAPDGWLASPLMALFHPSPEDMCQVWDDLYQEVDRLLRDDPHRREGETASQIMGPRPSRAELARAYESQPVRDTEEVTDLVARCVWDVFANNHDVRTADGRIAHLGTWRSASVFLADYTAIRDDDPVFGDELTLYGGTGVWGHRVDLRPIYSMIFRRLQAVGADWIYSRPRIYAIEPSGTDAATVTIVADSAHTRRPRVGPPAIVRAYQEVYQRAPRGWIA